MPLNKKRNKIFFLGREEGKDHQGREKKPGSHGRPETIYYFFVLQDSIPYLRYFVRWAWQKGSCSILASPSNRKRKVFLSVPSTSLKKKKGTGQNALFHKFPIYNIGECPSAVNIACGGLWHLTFCQ